MSAENESNDLTSGGQDSSGQSTHSDHITSTTSPKQPRKNPNPKRRGLKAEKEVRDMQKSTNLVIPRASFKRLVHEILAKRLLGMRISNEALEALQEATEMFISILFEDALLLSTHRKRETLEVRDLLLAKHLTDCA